MKSLQLLVALLASLLSTALAVGPLAPAAAGGDPYAPTIPTTCTVKLTGGAKLGAKRYRAGATLKVRVRVRENSTRSYRGPAVATKVRKGRKATTSFRYRGEARTVRLGKTRPGKQRVRFRTAPRDDSRFEACGARLRFRAVRR